LVKLENDQVTFRYKDSNTKTWLTKTLPVFNFMHDFLQHVLPRGFKKACPELVEGPVLSLSKEVQNISKL
jgi:hypothetical protein